MKKCKRHEIVNKQVAGGMRNKIKNTENIHFTPICFIEID